MDPDFPRSPCCEFGSPLSNTFASRSCPWLAFVKPRWPGQQPAQGQSWLVYVGGGCRVVANVGGTACQLHQLCLDFMSHILALFIFEKIEFYFCVCMCMWMWGFACLCKHGYRKKVPDPLELASLSYRHLQGVWPVLCMLGYGFWSSGLCGKYS